MASHTWNPSTARSARNRRSGLQDALHHIAIIPAHGGLIVEHHHHLQEGLGGMKSEFRTKLKERPSVEEGVRVGAESSVYGDDPTSIASRHVMHSMDDLHDHLDHHLGQMMEEHEPQMDTENTEATKR